MAKSTPPIPKQLANTAQVMAIEQSTEALLVDLRKLIDQARSYVAATADSAATMVYWHVGNKVRRETLQQSRAAYGGKIVATLSRELNWSKFRELLPLKQPLEREFYTEMCRIERWSVRTLRERIASQLYLRSAIAKQPESVIASELGQLREGGQVTPDLVFRDPYMLDFLGLPDGYSERDLESAILRDMERFLLELGAGFTFVARQKRISVGADDFYLDLLFYHRHLRRLVAVELKLEKFSPSHKGQMELYLRWLDQNDRAEGEASPIGLILCASTDAEQVELMDLDSANIRVAQYLHALPELQVLQTQLHRVVQLARERQATLEWPDNKEKT